MWSPPSIPKLPVLQPCKQSSDVTTQGRSGWVKMSSPSSRPFCPLKSRAKVATQVTHKINKLTGWFVFLFSPEAVETREGKKREADLGEHKALPTCCLGGHIQLHIGWGPNQNVCVSFLKRLRTTLKNGNSKVYALIVAQFTSLQHTKHSP